MKFRFPFLFFSFLLLSRLFLLYHFFESRFFLSNVLLSSAFLFDFITWGTLLSIGQLLIFFQFDLFFFVIIIIVFIKNIKLELCLFSFWFVLIRFFHFSFSPVTTMLFCPYRFRLYLDGLSHMRAENLEQSLLLLENANT